MTKVKLGALGLFAMGMAACSGAAEGDAQTGSSESQPFATKVADNVVVADPATSEATAVFDDRLEVSASGNERVLDLTTGAVFVGAPAEAPGARNPDGFLRKVQRAYRDGDRIVVLTYPAALTDAFADVDLAARHTGLEGATRGQSASAPSFEPQGRRTFKGIALDFAGTTLLDQRFDLTAQAGSANVSARVFFSKGTFTLTPTVETDLKIRWFKVARFVVAAEGQLDSEVELSAEVKTEGAFDVAAQKQLLDKVWEVRVPLFDSPTYPLPVQWVAGVPIALGVQFGVAAACSLRFEGALTARAGVTVSGNARARALYENGQWAPPTSASFSARPTFSFTTKAGLAARCEIDTSSNLKVYGVASAGVHVSPFLELEAKAPNLLDPGTYSWGVYPGARGSLAGSFEPLGFQVASFDHTLFDWRSPSPLVGSGP